MDLKCSIIHKHFFFFFFSAAILVPFPNILLLKRIITVQKQKVRRMKVLAAGRGWHVSCVCVLARAAPMATVPGLGAALCANFCRDFAVLLPWRAALVRVVWVCVVMLLTALHSCGDSSLPQCFPPF